MHLQKVCSQIIQDGVVESQQQLEESDLLVKEAIAMVSENSKTFLCCINVPDVEKAVEKMSGEYAKSINQIVEGHGFTGKVVKWKSQGGPNSSSTSFVALLLTRWVSLVVSRFLGAKLTEGKPNLNKRCVAKMWSIFVVLALNGTQQRKPLKDHTWKESGKEMRQHCWMWIHSLNMVEAMCCFQLFWVDLSLNQNYANDNSAAKYPTKLTKERQVNKQNAWIFR